MVGNAYGGNGTGNMMMNRPQYNNSAAAAGIAPNNPMVRAQRPPNVTVGPEGMNVWRQQQMAAMQQQQHQQQQQQVQQVQPAQQQQQQMARFQQQQQQQQQGSNNPSNVRMQTSYMQQQQTYMHSTNQGNMQQQVMSLPFFLIKSNRHLILSFRSTQKGVFDYATTAITTAANAFTGNDQYYDAAEDDGK